MKTVITTGPGVLKVVDRHRPLLTSDALVTLDRAGICGTDLKILNGATPVGYPLTLGHELVGIVTEQALGGKIPAGTRVMVNPGINCEVCYLCQRRLPHLCRKGGLLGRDFDGVFSEQIESNERYLHVVPDQVPSDGAGLLQVLGTVVHAQQTVSVSSDTVAVVIGLGVSGLLHLQLLRARGAGTVIGVTRSPWKLELAQRLGAHGTATPDESLGVVAEMSSGRGADLVIEAVGTEATVIQAIELCKPGADVIVYGTVTEASGRLPYYQLYFKEITLHSPRAARPSDYETAISLAAARRIELAPLVTARYPLKEVEAAFAAARSGNHLKVLLTP